MMRIPSYNNKKSALLVISIVLIMCSCKDSEIAKDMEGTWKRSYVTSYEDGTKSHVDEQITFQYDASDNEKDGGTFTEICTGQEETDEDEINAKYRWVSKIEGTWKIELGTLYQHYNLSTLEVEIGKDDVNLKIKDKAWLWNDWGELITAGLYAEQTILEDLKKETYKELFRDYKRLNNQDMQDIGFPDVQINSGVMSYKTGDMGRIEFHRVEDGNSLKRKKKEEEIAVENEIEDYNQIIQDDDNSEEITTEESDYYSHRLSGFIDKYEIYMFLNIKDDGNVSGYYYYDSQGSEKKIYLSGEVQERDAATQLTLNCDNQDTFDGYIEENKYSGEFSNRSNQLLFNLRMLN